MKVKFCVSAIVAIAAFAIAISAQTSTFTYQGRLTDGGTSANGTFDMQFKLFDVVSGGPQIGPTITNSALTVTQGIFKVDLDFGAPGFPGADRFLEVSVRRNSGESYTVLSPRQQIASSPYSLKTLSASTADSLSAACVGCVSNSQINGLDAAKLTGTVDDARLSGNVVLGTAPQTLTNKTIDSPSNSVTTDRLRSASSTINVSSAAAPSAGQVLTATGPTAATWQTATTGWSIGGNSLSATGNFGTTSNNHVDFVSNNVVRGRLSNLGEFFIGTTNTTLPGDLMNAVGNATFPWAVNGYTSGNGGGVYGQITAGTTNFGAVQGEYNGTGPGFGVNGLYTGSPAAGSSPTGLHGGSFPSTTGNRRIGVLGEYNTSHFGAGVVGIGFGGALPPATDLDYGVVGWVANNGNYSGYFNGNHVIANGTKSASVGTSRGNQLLYATESPEVWFEDIGSGKLINGEAVITLEKLFLETVLIDDKHPMHVFIQMEDDSQEVFVKKGTTSFTVKERNNGTSNASFSYRIIAKRLNFQDHRFGNDPVWGAGDTRRYSQYATPPPVDYEKNVQFQADQKRNWKPGPMPEGFKPVQEAKDSQPATRNVNR
ncbi:MAG: hypothetical protein IPL32_07225 [Chloracidobacterium sp.]|nr:hypothetical protein [Chloracidobacterium sp.]